MHRFEFDDVVRITGGVPTKRIGAKAWVVGITDEGERVGSHYDQFQPGTVYTVEFEDGASTDIGEADLAEG